MRVLAGSLLLSGCLAAASRPPAHDPAAPPGPADALAIPPEARAALDRFVSGLQADLSGRACAAAAGRFQEGAAGVQRWCESTVGGQIEQLAVEAAPYFMDGAALVFQLGLFAQLASGSSTGHAPAESARAQVRDGRLQAVSWTGELSDQLSGEMSAQTAVVTVDPEQGRLDADVTVRIQRLGSPLVGLRLRVEPDQNDGRNERRDDLRLLEISQDGRPCRYRVAGSGALVLVLPQQMLPEVRLRLRYAGRAPWRGSLDHVRADEVILRREAFWLPSIRPSDQADLRVTLVAPARYTWLGLGDLVETGSPTPGQRATSWRHRGSHFTVVGRPDFTVRQRKRRGTKLVLALGRGEPGDLDALERTVTRALDNLERIVPYPFAELRVSLTDFGGGEAGYGDVTNVLVGRQQAGDLAFVTHELAHNWFPGLVPSSGDAWPEALAEYLSSWSVPPKAAGRLREGWKRAWAAVVDRPEGATPLAPPRSPWPLYRAYAYDRAALILSDLERRVGREVMARCLAQLVRERRGRPSGWSEVLQSFRGLLGEAESARLRRELSSPGVEPPS